MLEHVKKVARKLLSIGSFLETMQTTTTTAVVTVLTIVIVVTVVTVCFVCFAVKLERCMHTLCHWMLQSCHVLCEKKHPSENSGFADCVIG